MKIITTNKQAFHDYFIIKSVVAGIVLEGSEVKSMRACETNLKDCFIVVDKKGEMYVKNMYIKPYDKSTSYVPDPRRSRKLLLHKAEIDKLSQKIKEKGFTLVPLKVYFEGKYVKMEVGLAQGKHTYDKRQVLAEKDKQRDLERQIKNYSR